VRRSPQDLSFWQKQKAPFGDGALRRFSNELDRDRPPDSGGGGSILQGVSGEEIAQNQARVTGHVTWNGVSGTSSILSASCFV
jgi:hypothetical protein